MHSWGCFRFFLLALFLCAPAGVQAGWVQQQSGTTTNLHEVFFVDAQTGWACGESCFVLRTTDGGQLWQKNIVDTGSGIYQIYSIYFQDANRGWIGGQRQNPPYFVSQLFTTSDGGMNWQLQLRDTIPICYSALEFVTPLKGWLVGSIPYSNSAGAGFLYCTSDGGASWVLRDSTTTTLYWDVCFTDSLYGLLAAGNPGFSLSSGFLKKTTDGGTTWQMQSWGLVMYRRVHCLDRDHIWRSEYYHENPNPDRWGVSKSSDQGVNWQSVLVRTRNMIVGPPFVVVDTLKSWALTWDTLYGSRDGGLTWTTQEPYSYMNNLCFVDSMNGWIVGSQGLILHTKDGGLGVWSETSPSRLTPYASRLTVFPNPFTSFTFLPGHEAERFSLYDISGRKVGTYKGDRIGEGLSAGVYFLRPQEGNAKPVRVVKVR